MKKSILTIAVLLLAGSVFAENYTVKAVKGRATIQGSNDKWVELTEGKEIDSTSVINTSINTVLFITDDAGKEIKIKANQYGSLETLITAATTPSTGIKRARIVKGDNPVVRVSDSNAVSRASEAKEDIDWDE